MNIAIQLFTFDSTRRVLQLFRLLENFLDSASKPRFVWLEHNGIKRTIALEKLLNEREFRDRMNEGYLQSAKRQFRPELASMGLRELIVHFSVSPSCEVWARSAKLATGEMAGVRKFVSFVESVERAATFRKPEPMPTVLEITMVFENTKTELLINSVCDSISRGWSSLTCDPKFGTVDCGGEWLFFPKSGYNPNASNVHVYFSPEARISWGTWRENHNVSFTSGSKAEAKMVVHSFEPRQHS